MMSKSVLLDTSFFITLLDSKRANHSVAKQYLRYFLENKFVLWLSSIVVSEYCHKGTLDEPPMAHLYVLPFTLEHAVESAALDFKSRPEDNARRDTAKDDYKLLAQAKCERAGFLMTDDVNSLAAYARNLVEEGKLDLRCISLGDGFDVALVNEDQQRELPESEA
ncbi:MAG: hypothetical protein ACPGSB_11135 [Opitutales bacterium]